MTQSAVEYIINEKPNLFAICFDEPDVIGHAMGWESDEYMKKINVLDGHLTEIFNAIQTAGIADNTMLIVAADHGGIGTGHGGKTMTEMEVPLVFWGKNVKKGTKIKNSTMIYDIASTILNLKHTSQPQVWIGRPVVEAFDK